MCSKGYSTWSVCLCVCLSVCLLLNISLFMCLVVPQTILTFSVADEGRKFLSDFLWNALLLVRHTATWYVGHFLLHGKRACEWIWTTWLTAVLFLEETFIICEFGYWLLAVSMPPTKVCLQCKVAVPVRWKTCVNTVIMSFDPNEKQSVICERKLWNVWE